MALYTPFQPRLLLIALCLFQPVSEAATTRLAQRASQLDLPGRIGLARLTPDHHFALVILSDPAQEHSQSALLLELTTSSPPRVAASLPLPGQASQIGLSDDGRRALLLLNDPADGGASASQIVEIDFSPPQTPTLRRQRTIPLGTLSDERHISIAPNASAYAISEPAAEESHHSRISVIGATDPNPITLEMPTLPPLLRFSSSARHVAFLTGTDRAPGSIGIVALGTTPVVSQQTFTLYHGRYRCLLGVLNSGHALLDDSRAPRLGLYAPQAGVPRVATVEARSDCSEIMAEDPATGSLTFTTTRGIARLDVHDPHQPRPVGEWIMPFDRHTLAIAGDTVLAGASDGHTLEIYRLGQANSAGDAFKWPALALAHQRIVEESRRSKDPPVMRQTKAFQELEAAGSRSALVLPVQDISNQQAALILNDIGVAASAVDPDPSTVRMALQRGLDLDPQRRFLYKGLGDLQRLHLAEVSGLANRQTTINEVARLYRKYLTLGGVSSADIEHFLRAVTAGDDAPATSVCQAVATYANDGSLSQLLGEQALGIVVNGQPVDLVFANEGPAHTPTMYAFSSDTDTPVDIKLDARWAHALWEGESLGVLIYHGAAQIISYRDATHPLHTASLTGGNECSFTSTTAERVAAKALEPELCRLVLQGEAPPAVAFDTPPGIAPEQIKSRYGDASAGHTARIDFENSGVPKRVLALSLTGVGGTGCVQQFYDVLDDAGEHLDSGADHDLIAALQGLQPPGKYPLEVCDNMVKFFPWRGQFYFESKSAHAPSAIWNEYHRVGRIQHGQAQDVCDIAFDTHVSAEESPHPATHAAE